MNAYCIAVLAQSQGQTIEGNQSFAGLAYAIVRLLKGAGVDIKEDQSLEENLANWMNKELEDINTLLQIGKTEEALSELIYLSKGLQKAGKKSPFFQFLAKFSSFARQILSTRSQNQPVVEIRAPVPNKIS